MRQDDRTFGFCKKHAPAPSVLAKTDDEDPYLLVWPSTGKDDWCFEFDGVSDNE
jgi:hypothetical protein